jgi:arylsulfatase A-like enzyme
MPDRPNVLLVFPDSLRGSALSCAGDPNVSTPTIDGLASRGVRFSNAYSTYPVCVPTRFTLMTGEYAHSQFVPSIGWSMSPTERTLPDEFGDAGFQTAHVGQYHLGGYSGDGGSVSVHVPQLKLKSEKIRMNGVPRELQAGFEYFRGFHGDGGDRFDVQYFADDDPTPRDTDGYHTDVLTDLAVDFLTGERDPDRPFFLRWGPIPPHEPYVAPESYMERWRDRAVELPPNVEFETGDVVGATGSEEEVRDTLRAYYAMVENIDDNVGRLLDTLESEGIREDTVVVVLSDHGEMLGSHGRMEKQWPYEESARVPFVVSHPGGGIDGGRVVTDPTSTEDWFPTLLGLAGVDPPDGKPGVDLSPLARGDTGGLDRPGVMLEFVEERREGFDWYDEIWRAFVTERYKYTVRGGAEGAAPWQLFDLEADPYEQENLIDDPDHEEVARELHGHLRERAVETGDPVIIQPAFGVDGVNEEWLDVDG